MKEKYKFDTFFHLSPLQHHGAKILKILILLTSLSVSSANPIFPYAQPNINIEVNDIPLEEFFQEIENQTEFIFFYKNEILTPNLTISIFMKEASVSAVLDKALMGRGLNYKIVDRQIIIYKSSTHKNSSSKSLKPLSPQGQKVSGTVTDGNGISLPGVNVIEKNTTNGTVSDFDGKYTITVKGPSSVLQFSALGLETKERPVQQSSTINITLLQDTQGLDEVILIGYGTQRKGDLTGSVVSVSTEELEERPSLSLMQSLQGAVAGMNVGQVNTAGGEPSLSIRGRTSISGTQNPLIVLDGVIFRGNLIDINPNDIKSIDILKDASSTAVYGSQAANGVIIVSTKTGARSDELAINYSTFYSILEPTQKFLPETPSEYIDRITAGYFQESRTESSGYIEPNPNFNVASLLQTPDQVRAYEEGIFTNWYDITTKENLNIKNHNISIAKRSEEGGFFISAGFADQDGYMINEGYKRFNSRINIDNDLTDWLEVGLQTFLTSSDYSGQELNPTSRYAFSWFAPAYEQDGITLLENPRGAGNINPYLLMGTEDLDKRLNLFGNVYANFTLPFVEGLSLKINYNVNEIRNSAYYFGSHENNFQGMGRKTEGLKNHWTNDYILTFDRRFNNNHKINVTVAYGREKLKFNSTQATANNFINDELGYNQLQAGSADLQSVFSSAWQETSLYYVSRLFYSFNNRYLFTGTVRTDGFSGFGEDYKFGTFPSASVAWVLSQENFIKNNLNFVNNLKFRVSYGANGNRTIGRYATLPRVQGNYGYVDGNNEPLYTQGITTLANRNLKWETTIGLNLGLDYSILDSRITGSIDYYNTNTKDLLYDVDLPGISRFEKIADNLGKLHNEGLEITFTTRNIDTENFNWSTGFDFSRNRNELRELLGFDVDGDGIEDDLISEELFIGESLGSIYDYNTNGDIWQLGEEIPNTADVGSYVITDADNDGVITPNDRVIVGNTLPAFRWSMNNKFKYKNWILSVFVNSVQGNENYYLGDLDLIGGGSSFNTLNSNGWDRINFPSSGIDFWKPENPDAQHQRLGVGITEGLDATRYYDRSFVRLQDVNLSYSFGKKSLEKLLGVDSMRLFLNGKNLYTWTKWPGWDPETGEGITLSGRPVLRQYAIGLDVQF